MAATRSPSGGGLLLSAIGAVTITGTLGANGAGGIGQFQPNKNGGGGAGSGGLIAIQAASAAVLGSFFANGGGGGGGANTNAMASTGDRVKLVGENGRMSTTAALGAGGEGGSPADEDGGNGAVAFAPATPGMPSNEGAGGGGGGVGYVFVIRRADTTVTLEPQLASPPPVVVGLDLQPL